MITIRIGDEERDLGVVDADWIHRRIDRQRAQGCDVCVKISVRKGELNMLLSTAACQRCAAGNRRPNLEEKRVFDLWERWGLDECDFATTHLVAFLRELRSLSRTVNLLLLHDFAVLLILSQGRELPKRT